ncbi:MAG: DsbE family thiol:disulfide interchange protein [Filomicrobium sp.]
MNENPKFETTKPRRRTGWAVAPLIIFLALAAAFAYSLSTGDPSKLPSALIGKPVPPAEFKPLDGMRIGREQVPGFDEKALIKSGVTVVNFWASWCIPCVQEHPLLIQLKKRTDVALYGVNYKDQPSAARRFIGRYGNPYDKIGTDPNGRGAIEWGVYGMPETFIIDGQGRIAYKHVGPITQRSLDEEVLPAIEKARKTASN